MTFEYRMSREQLLDFIKSKFTEITTPCSFCGGRVQRDLLGVHWITVDDDFGYLISPVPNSLLARTLEAGKLPKETETLEGKVAFSGPAPIKNPGHVACALFACSSCGNIWTLSLNILGLINTSPINKPALSLIRGGAELENVSDPDDGT